MSGLESIKQTMVTYFRETKQAAASVIVYGKIQRNDTEMFQKVFQVASYILQIVIINHPQAASLNRLVFVLKTVGMHDFFRSLKQFRPFTCPIDAYTIDENKTLDSLLYDVCGYRNETYRNEYKEQAVKFLLTAQLADMRKNDDAYTEQQFKDVLKNRLANLPKTLDNYNSIKEAFEGCNWDEFKVSIRHTPLIEKVTNITWMLVDVGCVTLYLQSFNLIDTAKLASKIGSYSGFQWVKNHNLDKCVLGMVCTAFALKFVEAFRKLQDDALTTEERKQARLDCITSIGELILWGTVALNEKLKFDYRYICVLGIFVKSVGIYSIVAKLQHNYFDQPKTVRGIAAAAA